MTYHGTPPAYRWTRGLRVLCGRAVSDRQAEAAEWGDRPIHLGSTSCCSGHKCSTLVVVPDTLFDAAYSAGDR